MNKQYICKICKWNGRTHLHHIIPKYKLGKDTDENLIELCPNHHGEASEDEEAFAIKYSLIGSKREKEEIEAIIEYNVLKQNYVMDLIPDQKRIEKMFELQLKYNFDDLDAVLYAMGVTEYDSEIGSYISFEEYGKLRNAEKDKEMKLCIDLGFGSGLRISEIVGFKRKNRKIRNKYYEDNTSIPRLTKDMVDLKAHQIRLEDGKSKWRSTVTSPLLTEEHLEMLPIKLPRRTVQYKFEQLCKKVLNKKMSFGILRHSFRNYQENVLKVPLPIVQQYYLKLNVLLLSSIILHRPVVSKPFITKLKMELKINKYDDFN